MPGSRRDAEIYVRENLVVHGDLYYFGTTPYTFDDAVFIVEMCTMLDAPISDALSTEFMHKLISRVAELTFTVDQLSKRVALLEGEKRDPAVRGSAGSHKG